MDTCYEFDINHYEVTYKGLLEEDFLPTEEEE